MGAVRREQSDAYEGVERHQAGSGVAGDIVRGLSGFGRGLAMADGLAQADDYQQDKTGSPGTPG